MNNEKMPTYGRNEHVRRALPGEARPIPDHLAQYVVETRAPSGATVKFFMTSRSESTGDE